MIIKLIQRGEKMREHYLVEFIQLFQIEWSGMKIYFNLGDEVENIGQVVVFYVVWFVQLSYSQGHLWHELFVYVFFAVSKALQEDQHLEGIQVTDLAV